jgi:hypothetical protein
MPFNSCLPPRQDYASAWTDQYDIPREWFILSMVSEKDTGKGLSAIAWMTSQLLAAAQITSHIGISFDHFFPTEIDMSSIPSMIHVLIDGVTTTLLQMRCDRRGPLPPRQKHQEYHIAD